MEKMLYFKDGANDAYCNKASALLSIRQTGDTTLTLSFVARSGDAAADTVALTITDETEVAVAEAIVNEINFGKEAFAVVFDAVSGDALHPDITGSAITLDSLT
jgi:fructoselysine-6-P-deglycase FrlB-like protein